jgi:hypothetical protein
VQERTGAPLLRTQERIAVLDEKYSCNSR